MKQIYFVVAIILMGAVHSTAQTPGTLDASFGTGGLIQTIIPLKSDDGVSILKQMKQADGKYLSIVDRSVYDDSLSIYEEHFYLYRFTPSGQPDPSFGTNGGVALAYVPASLFFLPDGKFLLLGNDQEELITWRLLPNGTTDLTYGFKGINYTGYFFYPSATFLQPDGKLVVAGTYPAGSKNVLVRFNPDGLADFTFGNNGEQYLPFDALMNYRDIVSIKQMTDGRMMMVANTYVNSANHCILIRLKSNFTYDSTFSNDGQMTISYSGFYFGDFDMDGTGRAIIAGTYYYNSFQRSALVFARVKANGNPDSTFGTNGIRTTTYGGQRDQVSEVKIQPDGKMIVVGSTDRKFAIMRINPNGLADGSFNTSGKTITSITGSTNAQTTSVSIEPDGKLLVTGFAFYPDSMARFTMARYHSGYNVGMEQIKTSPLLVAFPNPCVHQCTVSYTLQQAGSVQWSLYNLQGQLVKEISSPQILAAGSHQQELTLTDLPRGIFLLQVQLGNTTHCLKLVKE